jgi:hypothetical protein
MGYFWDEERAEGAKNHSLGFDEAEFGKTRCEKLSLNFWLILADFWQHSPRWPWCLIAAVRGMSAAMIKRQSQLPSAAKRVSG